MNVVCAGFGHCIDCRGGMVADHRIPQWGAGGVCRFWRRISLGCAVGKGSLT
jgi:hypothetical protein